MVVVKEWLPPILLSVAAWAKGQLRSVQLHHWENVSVVQTLKKDSANDQVVMQYVVALFVSFYGIEHMATCSY